MQILLTLPLLFTPGESCQAHAQTVSAESKDIVETALAAGSFKTLAAALTAAELVPALQGEGPFTVFAPSDEAFAKLPKETLADLLKPENRDTLTQILTYHVVPGRVAAKDVVNLPFASTLSGQRASIQVGEEGVKVAGARVSKTDIACSNGIIHVIDEVMLPNTMDLVDTAIDAGSFTTLVQAVQAAQLVETLRSDGPLTVFAPTDEAFAKLPADTLASLLEKENRDKLSAILTLHVVPGRVYASDAIEAGQAKSAQGQALHFTRKDGKVFVNGAQVVSADLDTTNGVIHVIDTVLLVQ